MTRLVAILILLAVAAGCWADGANMERCRSMCLPRPVRMINSGGCTCDSSQPDGGAR